MGFNVKRIVLVNGQMFEGGRVTDYAGGYAYDTNDEAPPGGIDRADYFFPFSSILYIELAQ